MQKLQERIRKGSLKLCRRGLARFGTIVTSPSKYDIPELNKSIRHGPLPTFTMQKFLTPEFRNEIAIVNGSSASLDSPVQLTYTQVYTQTYSFASSLRQQHNLKKGDVAAIMSPNHESYFSAFHGIALTGAASTTINPQYTVDEVKYQIELTRAKLLIAHPMCLAVCLQAAAGKIPVLEMDKLDLTGFKTPSQVDPNAFLSDAADFDDQTVVTIPFSSGTTGRAKGVMLTHRNITSNIYQTMPYEGKYLLKEHSKSKKRGVLLCPLPFYHIYGMTAGMCVPLHAGAKLVFMSSFDLQRYLELIQVHQVSRGHVVPPIVLALAKHPLVDNYDLSSVECLMSGAAPLGADVQVQAASRLKCIVKQAWGMTETSPCGAITPDSEIKSIDDIKGRSGMLAPGTEGKIVDPVTGADLPYTTEGELLVRGPQIMKGYFENDAATSATLRSDGWLHTGDIARFDDKGWLYITDRSKELIKYKGFQVPPAELEALILAMPEVKDVVVIPCVDEEAGEVPRAYVVKQDNVSADFCEADIIEFVHSKVAPFKRLRGGVRFAESIPKSPSGKLLRRVQIQLDRANECQTQKP